MNCNDCIHSRAVRETQGPVLLNQEPLLECRRFPPVPMLVPAQMQNGQIGMTTVFGFTQVRAGLWCGEFHSIHDKAN